MLPGFKLSRAPMHAASASWTRRYIRPWGDHHLPGVQVGKEIEDVDVENGIDLLVGVDVDVDVALQVGVPQQGGHT